MHMDPLMPKLVGAVFAILLLGIAIRRVGQPLVIGYLAAGLVLGPHGLSFIEDRAVVEHAGSIGVLLLLFFVGMEIEPRALFARWRVAIVGTGLQIGISVGCVAAVGLWLDWPVGRIALLGFVISLSSTAVVLKLVTTQDEVGRDVTAVLLAQDMAIVPMMLVISVLAGDTLQIGMLTLQGIGMVAVVGLVVWLARAPVVHLPLSGRLQSDPELQVFISLAFCFGFAMLAALLQLSAALGAFVAGLLIGAAKETHRFHVHMKPFEVVFVATFFVSVGMLIDVPFVLTHWPTVALLLALAFLTNTFVNAVVFRFLGNDWPHSLLAAAFLAQIGEFSFVFAQVGLSSQLISEYAYQMAIAVIAASLALSPIWISLIRRATRS